MSEDDLAAMGRSQETVDLAPHRGELEKLVALYGLRPEALILVESIPNWCRANGCAEPPPFLTAMSVIGDRFGSGVVVVRSPLERGFQGQTSLILYIGMTRYQWVTGDFLRAVKHLVLHELAHTRGIMGEQEADEWAYGELRALEGLPED